MQMFMVRLVSQRHPKSGIQLEIAGRADLPPLEVWKRGDPPLQSKPLYDTTERYLAGLARLFPSEAPRLGYNRQTLYRQMYNMRWRHNPPLVRPFPSMAAPVPVPVPPCTTPETECLVGWRTWIVAEVLVDPGVEVLRLVSAVQQRTIWKPLQSLEANIVPEQDNTSGIYAEYEPKAQYAHVKGAVYGQVNLWGRFVQGELAVRAQYAYPRNFYLHSVNFSYVDFLKQWRVPIYVYEPLRIYNPAEDGWGFEGDTSPEEGDL